VRRRPQVEDWTPGDRFFEVAVEGRPPLLLRRPTPFRALRLWQEGSTMERTARDDYQRAVASRPEEPTTEQAVGLLELRFQAESVQAGHLLLALWAHPEWAMEGQGSTAEERALLALEEVSEALHYTLDELVAVGAMVSRILVEVAGRGPDWDRVNDLLAFGVAEARSAEVADPPNSSSRTSAGDSTAIDKRSTLSRRLSATGTSHAG